MFSTPLIMGFFRRPKLGKSGGRPMKKSDLKMLVMSVCCTMVATFALYKLPMKSPQLLGLMLLVAFACVFSTARVIEDSRRRCKL